MHEITENMMKAGLKAFMAWSVAPQGVSASEFVASIYVEMADARDTALIASGHKGGFGIGQSKSRANSSR